MSKYKKGEALPLEEFLYLQCNPVLGTFLHEKMKMTPNMITTITLLLSFMIGWNLWNNNYYIAFGLLAIRQVLDSCDGFIARKYSLSSKFGERYDQVSDTVNQLLMSTIMIYKGRKTIQNNKMMFAILFTAMITIYRMCERRVDCMKGKGECADPNIKHIVLKYTNIFSFFEKELLQGLLIILFSRYI
jgi:phosphatidylglycerophosphate synthase